MTAIILSFGALRAPASPYTIELAPYDSGWYSSRGLHVEGHLNYVVEVVDPTEWRNYFVFDLTGIVTPVESAELQLFTWDITGTGTYGLYDYSSSPPDILELMRGHSSGSTGGGREIFKALGTGQSYGSLPMHPGLSNSTVSISLNAVALEDLNSTDNLWALSGRAFGLSSMQSFFGNSDAHPENKLILHLVPEPRPEAVLLLGAGVGMAAQLWRRKRPFGGERVAGTVPAP